MNFRLAPLDSINLSFMIADDDMIFSGGWWSLLSGDQIHVCWDPWDLDHWDLHLQPSSCLSLLSVNLQSIVSAQSARHQGELKEGRARFLERIKFTCWIKQAQCFAYG